MISVETALDLILKDATPLRSEPISVRQSTGRILAIDIHALRTHPPHDVSAMDGYAAKASESFQGNELAIIGEAPAGSPFIGRIGTGQCVRIFTGGILPQGADHIIIQEDTDRHENRLMITATQNPPRHIRKAGIDFKTGDKLVESGTQLTALHAGLLAGAGIAELPVIRRPKVAIFANGDELSEVETPSETGIISSTPVTLCEWVKSWGGDPDYLGIARDDLDSLSDMVDRALHADIIVPLGGASVGDYDLVKTAFEAAGYDNIFSKIAVKPGKPTWFGRLDGAHVLGLPGNPASGLVCAQVFLKPLIKRLCGHPIEPPLPFKSLPAAHDIPLNVSRAVFHRGYVNHQGRAMLHPKQDSSLMSTFAKSDILVFQPDDHEGHQAGEFVHVIQLI